MVVHRYEGFFLTVVKNTAYFEMVKIKLKSTQDKKVVIKTK